MRSPVSATRRSGGFSLVEMLLAMTLLSMLLALAYGGLRASARATEKGQVILDDSNRIRMAHQFVRRQLTQLLPLAFDQGEGEAEDQRIVFQGDARRIRYVAPMPGYLGYGGPQVQELEIVPGEEGLELVLSHALLQGFEEEHLYQREPILLLDKIQQAGFQFLGMDENGEVTAWSGNWDQESQLPVAVTLEVDFVEEVYIEWPMLTTSVRVDESALSGMADDAGVLSKDYTTSIRKLMEKRENRQ
jgi:general secretion pathway protein J